MRSLLIQVISMSATPATKLLDKLRMDYQLHEYAYDPTAQNIGMQAADALGVDPARLFKCLMFGASAQTGAALIPTNKEMNLKLAAKALNEKKIRLLDKSKAEKLSGYAIGGISPLGQRSRCQVLLDQSAMLHETLLFNGGKRGLQIEMSPLDFVATAKATIAALT